MKILIYIILSFNSTFVFGYVENTTKGYANCMACHVAPNGGGVLNDYGRSLSAEMMSTWKGPKGFERPFYGLGHNTKNIKFGGQYRVIQVHAENNQIKLKKQFTMQNNLEFAAKYKEAFLVGTVGRVEGPEETPDKGDFLSERHFLLWETSDESRLRIGKFRQHFGINSPNHTRFVKNSLGFGSNSESYNLEYSKYYEWGEINTSMSVGSIFDDETQDTGKRNIVFNYTHYLGGNSRVGTSLLVGKSEIYKRKIVGLNAVFPIGKKIVAKSEVNFENKVTISNNLLGNEVNALYGDHTYGLKLFKGGLGYLIFEHSQSDLADSDTLITSPGLGFQFLPIPHVELQLEYQRRRYKRDSNNQENRSFVVFHLYH